MAPIYKGASSTSPGLKSRPRSRPASSASRKAARIQRQTAIPPSTVRTKSRCDGLRPPSERSARAGAVRGSIQGPQIDEMHPVCGSVDTPLIVRARAFEPRNSDKLGSGEASVLLGLVRARIKVILPFRLAEWLPNLQSSRVLQAIHEGYSSMLGRCPYGIQTKCSSRKDGILTQC